MGDNEKCIEQEDLQKEECNQAEKGKTKGAARAVEIMNAVENGDTLFQGGKK